MKTFHHYSRPRRAARPLVAALMVVALAMPASAGTTLVSGTSVFNTQCQAPVGDPPANLGDYRY